MSQKYEASDFEVNGYGLVPVEIKISEAGAGLIEGEVRGVAPDVAALMCNLGTAAPVKLTKAQRDAVAADIAASQLASEQRAPDSGIAGGSLPGV